MATKTEFFNNTIGVKGVNANGTVGTSGQVLTSNGSATYWFNNPGYAGSVGFTGSTGFTGSIGYTGSLPTNYITTNTDQTDLSGTKSWSNSHTFNANTFFANNIIDRPQLRAVSEFMSNNATANGTVTLDLSLSNIFNHVLVANTTFAFTNAPSGRALSFTIITKQDGTGGRTITWPASKLFPGGVSPPPTTTANAIDVWSVFTYDAGTTYLISLAIKDAK